MLEHHQDLPERLRESSVEMAGGCRVWVGSGNGIGYGTLSVDGRTVYAHREAYAVAFGPIPDGMVVDHLCRNRACINPHHMELVTNAENIRRGVSPSAINRRKTHCKRGHRFDAENTYRDPNGGRYCKECKRMHNRNWRARRSARKSPIKVELS